MQWTIIQATAKLEGHTISLVAETELLLVGGYGLGQIRNQVRLFNAATSEWSEEAPLPSQFGGSKGGGRGGGGGLMRHRAIEIPKKNGTLVLCVGGYIGGGPNSHPKQMIVFDVDY